MAAKKIVFLDDDLTLAEMYSERLKAAGYEVEVGHDGEVGLALIQKHKPDIVLLDIMMPKMNGFDVLKSMKADTQLQAIPAVMLTALIQDLDKDKGLTQGAVGYLVKSETMPGELVAKVEEFLKAAVSQSNPDLKA